MLVEAAQKSDDPPNASSRNRFLAGQVGESLSQHAGDFQNVAVWVWHLNFETYSMPIPCVGNGVVVDVFVTSWGFPQGWQHPEHHQRHLDLGLLLGSAGGGAMRKGLAGANLFAASPLFLQAPMSHGCLRNHNGH